MFNSSRLMCTEQDEASGGDEQPARNGERRARTRNYAVYRACRVTRGQVQAIGIIRNTSSGGSEIQTLAPFSIGEEITYEDPHLGARAARIVWARDDRIGVENIATLEGSSEESSNRQHRAIRFEMEKRAKIWMSDKYEAARLYNVSQTGACLLLDRGCVAARIGALASLSFDGRTFRPSVLRWHQGARVGFRFESSLTLWELSDLLSSRDASVTT